MTSSPALTSPSPSATDGSKTSQASGAPSVPCFGADAGSVMGESTRPIGVSSIVATESLPAVGGRLVDQDLHSVADGLDVGEAERLLVARLAKHPLAGAEEDREHHQAQLADQILVDQRLDQRRAAVDDDVAVDLVPQPRNLLADVAPDHGRVGPLRILQGARDDVLRHLVELVGELALARRPRLGEALIRHAAQEQGLRAHRLLQFEPVALLAARDLKAPASVPVVLGSAGV